MIFLTDPPSDPASALERARSRGLLPTSLSTAQIRAEILPAIRARSVFSARVTRAEFLEQIKAVTEGVVGGEMDRATARATLRRTLRALGYDPASGFPGDDALEIPPATEGTLRDLSSDVRLNLIVKTQADLMRGAAQKARGREAARLATFPAWELVRISSREEPRDWPARWAQAGGIAIGDRLIAPKTAEIWDALGDSALFDDALDTDHPPFAFNSGMGWREVSAAEFKRLTGDHPPEQIAAPEGEGAPAPALPKPTMSTAGLDPLTIAELKRQLAADEAREGGRLTYNDILAREIAGLNR